VKKKSVNQIEERDSSGTSKRGEQDIFHFRGGGGGA
jgi:hypothetical protein